jgi:hypothetical protein
MSFDRMMKCVFTYVMLCVIMCAASGLAASDDDEKSLWCGQVFDGTVHGADSDAMDSAQVGAHWTGFTDGQSGRVTYEWAVVPASSSLNSLFEGNRRCTRDQVLAGWRSAGSATKAIGGAVPRVMPRSDDSSSSADGQPQQQRYHVLVRATHQNGESLVSRSNGFALRDDPSSFDCDLCLAIKAEQNDARPLDVGHSRGPPAGTAAPASLFNFSPGEVATADFDFAAFAASREIPDDDDDELSNITKAGIAIGVGVGFFLLVAIGVIFYFGGGASTFGDSVMASASGGGDVTHIEYN